MEERKNLCAMLPVALHARVRQEQEKAGMTLGEYVEAMITEYYDWKDGRIMTGEMRTLAAQIPAELFDAGCKTEKDLKVLTLPTILKIPDVTVPDMTVITELQEQVAKNRLFSYLGGGRDEPSDTTE